MVVGWGSLGRLKPDDIPPAAVDFHISSIIEGLLVNPNILSAATAAAAKLGGDPAGALKSAMWNFSGSCNHRALLQVYILYKQSTQATYRGLSQATWHARPYLSQRRAYKPLCMGPLTTAMDMHECLTWGTKVQECCTSVWCIPANPRYRGHDYNNCKKVLLWTRDPNGVCRSAQAGDSACATPCHAVAAYCDNIMLTCSFIVQGRGSDEEAVRKQRTQSLQPLWEAARHAAEAWAHQYINARFRPA